MRLTETPAAAGADHIIVKVAQLPGQVRDIALNGPENRTLANALQAYGTPLNNNMEISVGGRPVAPADFPRVRLENGDVVTISQKLKGA